MKVFPPAVSLTSAAVLGMSTMASAQFWWGEGLDEGDWGIKDEVFPDEPGGDNGFGWQVALTDDAQTMVVGSYYNGTNGCCATYETDANGNQVCVNDLAAYGTGSARVFVRSTNPDNSVDWTQQGLLIGDDGAGGVYAGYTVEVDGDTAIVAGYQLPCNGHMRVFVFVRNAGGEWSQEAMLHDEYDFDGPNMANPYYDDGRVSRIALQGDIAVVGRPTSQKLLSAPNYISTGSAIVYVRSGSTWTEQALLEASDGADGDYFGADVDISGDVILVGAPQRNRIPPRRGKAYVFRQASGMWTEEATLYPEDDVSDEFLFGSSVGLDAGTAIIGHGRDWDWDVPIDEAGLVYAHVFIFDAGSSEWNLQSKLFHPSDEEWARYRETFGSVVAIKGDLALVGDGYPWYIMLYERTGSTWNLKQLLSGFNMGWSDPNPNYGNSRKLALASDTAIVAVDGGFQLHNNLDDWRTQGSAYVFDSFSYLPPGPWEIEFLGYFIDTMYDDRISSIWHIGSERAVEAELLQKDCATNISDTEINPQFTWREKESFTYDIFNPHYLYENSTIVGSSIFNPDTWEIEVCSRVRLVDSTTGNIETEAVQVLTQFFDASNDLTRLSGPWEISYSGFWSWNNFISVWYLTGSRRETGVELLQKDCATTIDDTEINVEVHTSAHNFTFDSLNLVYTFDSSTIGDSVVFNNNTSQLEVCSRVVLFNSSSGDVEVEHTENLLIDVVQTPDGTVTGNNGDPHMTTWDGLKFDCQAAGEFVTITSLEDPTFQIQERFSNAGSELCSQASVSTGVAVRDTSKPLIQISTPKTGQPSLNTINSCPIDFYLDGTPSTFTADLSETNVVIEVNEERIRIEHTDTLLSVEVTVQTSNTFGCLFMVQVYLPAGFRSGESILGLLGTPNGDISDEWTTSDGTALQAPTTDTERLFSTAYNYCVDNWCIDNSADSMFTYGTDESFADISGCDLPYDGTVENQVLYPSPDLGGILYVCGSDNLECLVDGICGDISDASQYLENDAIIEQTQAAVSQQNPPAADWDIVYNNENLVADFTLGSVHEVTLDYSIAVGRDFETETFADCDTETLLPDGVITLASTTRESMDSSYDKLILAFDIDKSAIVDSSLWNEATSELLFCQRVSLVTPDTDADPGMPVVTENTDLAIYLDLSAGFVFVNGVGGKANTQGGGSANFDGFVKAYKCDNDGGFTDDPSALLPNDQLFVCIISLSTDAAIDFIESMTVAQDFTSLDVVLNSAILNPSMTDWRYSPAFNGWVVSTRVPTRLPNDDIFLFQPGESITISGSVELELFSLFGRKLDADNANEPDNDKRKASFKVGVQLDQYDEMVDGIGIRSSSFSKNNGLVSTTAVFALIYAML